jgi:hypothetical protein
MSEPLLTSAQAAAYLGYSTRAAFDKAVVRLGLSFQWIGRRKRFKASELDRAVRAMTLRRVS